MGQQRVFLSYKRNTLLDQPLAERLHRALTIRGHRVFIDKGIEVGENWVRRITAEIESADHFIILLSELSVQSEMVVEEVRLATAQQKISCHSKPKILPVRVGFKKSLPYHLGAKLNDINYASWDDEHDDEQLIEKLYCAIESSYVLESSAALFPLSKTELPLASAEMRVALEAPEGTMHADSRFYVSRLCDRNAQDAISHGAFTLTIQGPRQCGKSSLLVQVLGAGRARGQRVAFIDFQGFGSVERRSPEKLYLQFCMQIEDELKLASTVDTHWDDRRSLTHRCTRFMERVILPECKNNGLLLAIDEADSLLDSPASSDFFGMLRTWHNRRANHPDWKDLSIALVISTEPHLLIANLSQSPFNVGALVRPDDFQLEEALTCNIQHGSPLTQDSVIKIHQLLGGHPYLTRKAMYQIVQGRDTAETLVRDASSESGPFGDHLRALLARLQYDAIMPSALREALRTGQISNSVRPRLIAGGMLKEDRGRLVARNNLYSEYFSKVL